MKFLYVRVSTQGQNTDRQEQLKTTYKVDKVYIDKLSGKNTNRPQFQEMLKQLRKNDTVIVESYSRASRSTKDLLELVELLNSKEVNFISIKENLDTSTPAGRLMLTMFAGLYQFERECMLERQKEGIKIAKEKGAYKNVGRKKIAPNDKIFANLYKEWKNGNIKACEFMKALNLQRNTFYRRVKEFEKANNIPGEKRKKLKTWLT
jgi:DNA invertase Pin-like site-specific DNA recombinase